MTEGFTDAFERDPVGARDRFFRLVAERYNRWVRRAGMPADVARNRVSPGTVNLRLLKSIDRKIANGEPLTSKDVERMTMRAIRDKIYELRQKEDRRGPAGKMAQLSQVGDGEALDRPARVLLRKPREPDPAKAAEDADLLEAIHAVFDSPTLAENEAALLREFLVTGSRNAAADRVGIPRSSAKRIFNTCITKLRERLGGPDEEEMA